MIELKTAATKFIIPLSVTLSTLPIFQLNDTGLIPSSIYETYISDASNLNWDNYDPFLSMYKSADDLNYKTITDFATKFVSDTKDIPPEFSRMLIEDFWNLV